ncbi:MAG TPA: sugar phosphate isomerase/epimerase family protein [Phycisphaerales bacterium]|nr:sugar phosphate isomerase/epimerase family protein [Phycisphaerales bacterium]
MPRLGLCSWSLQPAGPDDLARSAAASGVGAIQLALDPIRSGAWPLPATRAALRGAGLTLLSGMMAMEGEDYSTLASIRRTGGLRPDEHWRANLAAARANARLARTLDLSLVTFHAGFIPEDPADPQWSVMLGRVAELAAEFATLDVRVALETGQESAAGLARFLAALPPPGAGVNFDPANMVLYGSDEPERAVAVLGPHIVQVHVKDARPAGAPGAWGTEVPVGRGAVGWPRILGALRAAGVRADLVIEREAGGERLEDLKAAAHFLGRVSAEAGYALD